jgi:tetratricopeptide (TPR) repeat protein
LSWLGDCHKKAGEMQEAIDCYSKAYKVSGNETYKK